MRSVDFIGEVLEVYSFAAPGALLDGAFDIVAGHIGGAAFQQHHAEARIHIWIRPADLYRDGDFLAQLGKNFAPFGIDRPFEMLYFCPFAMAGHAIWLRVEGRKLKERKSYMSCMVTWLQG